MDATLLNGRLNIGRERAEREGTVYLVSCSILLFSALSILPRAASSYFIVWPSEQFDQNVTHLDTYDNNDMVI